jgi:hypothetical protein
MSPMYHIPTNTTGTTNCAAFPKAYNTQSHRGDSSHVTPLSSNKRMTTKANTTSPTGSAIPNISQVELKLISESQRMTSVDQALFDKLHALTRSNNLSILKKRFYKDRNKKHSIKKSKRINFKIAYLNDSQPGLVDFDLQDKERIEQEQKKKNKKNFQEVLDELDFTFAHERILQYIEQQLLE